MCVRASVDYMHLHSLSVLRVLDSMGSERMVFLRGKSSITRTLFDGVLTRPFVDLDPTEAAPAAPVEPQGEAPATPLEPHGEAPAAASGNQVWRLLATKYGGSL